MLSQPITALLALALIQAALAAEIRPAIGEPLRDAAVTRGPDGTFYLTGTRCMARRWAVKPDSFDNPYCLTESKQNTAPDGSLDFMDNDGVKVWSSEDLVNWKDDGLAWDLMQFEPGMYSWRGRVWALPERKVGDRRVRGLTSPKFFHYRDRWYLVESYAGHQIGLLASKGDRIMGPYRPHYKQSGKGDNRVGGWGASRGPGYGMLFEDRDGAVYLIWGPGYIVKMKADLSMPEGTEPIKVEGHLRIGPEGDPRHLLAAVKGYPNAEWCARQFAPRAFSIYRDGETYLLVWSAMTDTGGMKREDSFIATAKNLDGPYSEPRLLVAGSGPAVIFDAGDRGPMLSCSMNEAPVLIPLERREGTLAASGIEAPTPVKPELPGNQQMYDYANSQASGKWHQPHSETGRSRLVPLFDLPMTDICIAKGDDGYYLTGTVASKRANGKPDFENNDGIYLWKSTDLNIWTPLGKVWDIERDGNDWARRHRVPADNPILTRFCRGVTAPEIRYARGTYWIPYSMNGRGTGLLKSKTGKADGPYEDLGRLTNMGGSPSLLIEEGEKPLWLWGDLMTASMNDDMTALSGAPVSLYLQLGGNQVSWLADDNVDMWDNTAPHVFTAMDPNSNQKRYYLTWSAISQGTARALRETFVSRADSPLGPYTSPVLMIPHGGQSSVFEGPDGKLYASFYGADPSAAFRDRPGIVPLEFGFHDMPRKVNYNYYTHRGPWDGVKRANALPQPVDFRLTYLPDGRFYFGLSASFFKEYDGGVPVWRSPDTKEWEYLGHLYTHAQGAAEENWPAGPMKPGWLDHDRQISWTCGLYYLKGDYYLKAVMNNVPGKRGDAGPLLKSTSGKAEGPYAFHAPLGFETLFEDTDGKVYGVRAGRASTIVKLTDDLTAIDKEWIKPLNHEDCFKVHTDMNTIVSTDCNLLPYGKIDGKYLWGSLNGWRGYCGRFYVSDSPLGPLCEIGTIPYMGHGMIARGKDGVWRTVFQFMHSHHWMSSPTKEGGAFVLPVHLEMGDKPFVALQYDHQAGVRDMSVYGE